MHSDNDELELFQPSNHTQGESFMADHCYKCSKWPHSQEAKNQCKIALRTMAFDIDDPRYPREWRYVDGTPTCTAFVDRAALNARRRATRKPKLIPVTADDMFAAGGQP